MKLGIVGTRNPGVSYQDWEDLLLAKIDLSKVEMVVSGGAKGIDTYAKKFAARHHIPLMEYLPEYSKYGRKATLIRNIQIVKEASMIIAFPSYDSKGTLHSMREARRLGKPLIVVNIPQKVIMDRIKIGHHKIDPWELSNFPSRETGVDMTIWVTESQCISTPFIIVTPGYKSFSRHGIIISIDEPPEVLYPEDKTVEPSTWQQIVSWIRLNRRSLLQLWDGQISIIGFCQNLMEI